MQAYEIQEFRCLLRDYFDAQRNDWSAEVVNPILARLMAFVDGHQDQLPEIEELFAFLFVDADPGLEELLAVLVPRFGLTGLREEILLLGERMPRLKRTGHIRRLLESFASPAAEGSVAESGDI